MKLLTTLVTASALASSASAAVAIVTTTKILTSITNLADQTKLENKIESAWSTYYAAKTAEPEYSSYTKAFSEYVVTRTDAPASLILNTAYTSTVTTVPAWWSAMPQDLQDYAQEISDDQMKIAESIVKEGVAARPTGAAGLVGMGMAAAAAGAAILL